MSQKVNGNYALRLAVQLIILTLIPIAMTWRVQQVWAKEQPVSLMKSVDSVELPDEQLLKKPVLTVSNLTLNPPQATDIDDGLNWSPAQDNMEIGYTNPVTVQGKSIKMGFTFGSWSATSFSAQSLYCRKANIFLQDGVNTDGSPKNIQAFFYGNNTGPSSSSDYTILFSSENYTSLLWGSQLTYFVSKDSRGAVQAVKVMGYYSDSLEFEEILQRSPYSNGGVTQALYMKNISSTSHSYFIGDHEDTELENEFVYNGSTCIYSPDHVPIYALGNNRGMYFESLKHRLNVNTDLINGPAHWAAEYYLDEFNYNSTGISTNLSKSAIFKGTALSNVTGQEVYNYPSGTELLPQASDGSYPDSAYSLLWPQTNLSVGQTKHYAVDIGMTTSSYSIPKITETWRNASRADGKNYPQNQLDFTVNLGNDGKDSEYQTTNLSNLVPEGVNVNPKSFKLKDVNGNEKSLNYNEANRGLQLSSADAINLKDNQTATVTFSGTISQTVNGSSLTTTPQMSAVEQKLDGNPTTNVSGTEITIPLSKSTYDAQLTQTALDRTRNLPTNYYVPGDTIDFYVHYKIAADSTDTISAIHFVPSVSAGLTGIGYVAAAMADDDSTTSSLKATYQQASGATWPSQVNVTKRDGMPFKAGDQFTVTITGVAGKSPDDKHSSSYKSLSQTVDAHGTLTSGNDLVSDPNKLTIMRQDFAYFKSVPTAIDFGKAVNTGQKLANKTTTGKLKVNSFFQNSTDSNIDVCVSYTSDLAAKAGETSSLSYNSTPISNNNTKISTITPTSGSNDGLSGYYDRVTDLTALVGPKSWQLTAPKGIPAGDYKGKLTWSMVNSL